ncbi:MAG: TIGR03087 family PEP-CTERM/XrtA system glycosyltransferase [Gammaproteobacteria bacterium]|nr:TIGR03087 family PEP-CTERM/XrtA system glycosyltransferase [Gammaproteobacteria bacterium]NNF59890.1 TIGR03087 family PEP-CTERM/XrtA system glycosyltransferase [Gammaproteobacteria bacterium]NNM21624.1 TIGR03087 family PEP-CTERM/XrtA system glycosyltransferase [Gammaproteobacteria bacterium]
MTSNILMLTHRIPWPPDKGDKIRSFQVLRHLTDKHNVHLGTFVDDPDDMQYVPELERLCAGVCVRPVGRARRFTRGVQALLSRKPVTTAYYADNYLSRWVDEIARKHRIDAVFVYSAGVAQHAEALAGTVVTVLDMVDVDSAKWRQYAQMKSGPTRLVYRREARLLAREEARLAALFDRTLLVSEQEAADLAAAVPQLASRIGVMPNGVDTKLFSPEQVYDNPFPADVVPVVFTGAMDYWANVEGVQWFADSILHRVQARIPNCRFYIVGSRPSREVRQLGEKTGVEVTGRVPDVRPYLAHSRVAVAPLRVARGLQNKVLEALAMNCSVVATPAAARGIGTVPGGLGVALTAEEFAREVVDRLGRSRPVENRRFVERHFSWPAALQRLDQALAGDYAGVKVV